ncbi:MAG: hypothetical protein Q9157_005731 [Trypethelium eluteriae]
MASSYPPPPTPDQQPYNPYQHAPPISTSQIQEAAEAAGAAVQSVQAEQSQEQQASGLAYNFPKADQGIAEATYHNHAAASHAHRQDLQGDAAHQKANRLRKACDSCSIRKVKGVCSSARGEGYLFKEDISVYDAATSYFLGLSYFFTGQILRSHFAFRECLIILETLKPWKQQDSGDEFGRTPTMPQDLISQEMGKRIFWNLWSTLQSLRLSDASFTDVLIHPESDSYRYPPLPVERDDHRIHLAFVEDQQPEEVDLIRAFNSRVLTQRSVDLDPRSGLSKGPLIQALQQCKAALAELPPQLAMHGASLENGLLKVENDADAPRDPAFFIPADNEKDPNYRYTLQHKTQSRDLFVNQLSTRVRIVQGYNSLLETENPIAPTAQSKDPGDLARVAAAGLDGMMQGQRQEPGLQNNGNPESHEDYTGVMDDEQDALIIDLLSALADVAYVNFEPFDDHYVSSLRNLSYMLLSPHFVRKRPLLENALPYLQIFLQALDQLEQAAMPTQESEAISMQMAADLDPELERRFWEDIDRAQATFKALIKKEKE